MLKLQAGIDLGGTKIEIIVLNVGIEVYRHRIATPSTYKQILQAVAHLHQKAQEALADDNLALGIAMPGAFTDEGLVKNANTVCLNGKDFLADLQSLLGQSVAVMNDANLFALSEAVDGAAALGGSVFGVILGTGVGGGLVLNKTIVQGCNRIAGEWGHNPMPATAAVTSSRVRPCYCGSKNCIETFLSGAGLLQTYAELVGANVQKDVLTVEQMADVAAAGNEEAKHALLLYSRQVAAAVATVINIIDPDIIVLGGGLSNLPNLADKIQAELLPFVFSGSVKTAVVRNKHGDSSGVRGAAWLCV